MSVNDDAIWHIDIGQILSHLRSIHLDHSKNRMNILYSSIGYACRKDMCICLGKNNGFTFRRRTCKQICLDDHEYKSLHEAIVDAHRIGMCHIMQRFVDRGDDWDWSKVIYCLQNERNGSFPETDLIVECVPKSEEYNSIIDNDHEIYNAIQTEKEVRYTHMFFGDLMEALMGSMDVVNGFANVFMEIITKDANPYVCRAPHGHHFVLGNCVTDESLEGIALDDTIS